MCSLGMGTGRIGMGRGRLICGGWGIDGGGEGKGGWGTRNDENVLVSSVTIVGDEAGMHHSGSELSHPNTWVECTSPLNTRQAFPHFVLPRASRRLLSIIHGPRYSSSPVTSGMQEYVSRRSIGIAGSISM